MVIRVATVAFVGLEARSVDVECQLTPGLPGFALVGLADKAVTESRERVRGALTAIGLSLPPKKITINLSPADLPKEGAHYDLPIALALMGACGLIDQESLASFVAIGELGLDGRIRPCPGVLPAALAASAQDRGLICPAPQGGEAAWAGPIDIVAAPDLVQLLDHLRGRQTLPGPVATLMEDAGEGPDLAQVKGQPFARRALEIAAAGGHNLLFNGPPGSGKSLMAACLPGLLPPLSAAEALDVSVIASLAGVSGDGRLSRRRPFRAPHHSASIAALTGGGTRVRPGEVSLAHRGVLFLDELPEFQRAALESLRQPLETGRVTVARATGHLTFPARFQLVAAMNPCRCGYLDDAARACGRAPRCALDYQARISGPLLDRIDLQADCPAISARVLMAPADQDSSAIVAARVATARARQGERYGAEGPGCNAEADGPWLERHARPDRAGQALMEQAVTRLGLSARGYTRILRVARTLADLAESDKVCADHVGEAIGYRPRPPVKDFAAQPR